MGILLVVLAPEQENEPLVGIKDKKITTNLKTIHCQKFK